jgi:hypothetical protein
VSRLAADMLFKKKKQIGGPYLTYFLCIYLLPSADFSKVLLNLNTLISSMVVHRPFHI